MKTDLVAVLHSDKLYQQEYCTLKIQTSLLAPIQFTGKYIMVVLMKKDYHMEIEEPFANYDIVVKTVIQKNMKKGVAKFKLVI